MTDQELVDLMKALKSHADVDDWLKQAIRHFQIKGKSLTKDDIQKFKDLLQGTVDIKKEIECIKLQLSEKFGVTDEDE